MGRARALIACSYLIHQKLSAEIGLE
ncbi:hypothetical protein VDGL01_08351 [Verticillium dahliae]